MSKHTPGPLFADVRTGMAVISTKPTPCCLSEVCDGEILRVSGTETQDGCSYKVITDEQRANIHLWAAAPEMLEALKLARDGWDSNNKKLCTRAWKAMNAAIAHAEGRK